jgi:hypothetical protein
VSNKANKVSTTLSHTTWRSRCCFWQPAERWESNVLFHVWIWTIRRSSESNLMGNPTRERSRSPLRVKK